MIRRRSEGPGKLYDSAWASVLIGFKEILRMKTGLVPEGGAMRGIYKAGVLDVFLKNHIRVDGVIGVSAGAIHGCSYVSGQYRRVRKSEEEKNGRQQGGSPDIHKNGL